MPYAEHLPDPQLRGLVRAYWQIEHIYSPGEQQHQHLPERSVHLVFSSGASWMELAGTLQALPAARLEGMTLGPLRVRSLGPTRMLGADLYPWGARQLFGWEAGGLVDLAAHFAKPSHEITALVQLGELDGARQRLEAWLLELLQERGQTLGKGAEAAAHLYRNLGRGKIGDLAEELNLSPRQLERQFVQEVGLGAKTLARLIRFEEVHNRLWETPDLPLATLAYDLGFSDQAHLNREFKALSDMTPGQFVGWTKQRSRQEWQLSAWANKESRG